MTNPEKLAMHTPSLTEQNIAAIAALFPNALTEKIVGYEKDEDGDDDVTRPIIKSAIDFDVLRQEVSFEVVEGREERYQFTWPDKKKSILLANAPIAAALRPCREESVDFDTTENLYIEGDNLDVLKLLRETYLNRVKMIYIDPPYNTGNDFVFEDDFAEDAGSFLNRDGQYDEQGNRLVKNLDSNGRFHTDWLNMIYPRLRVARDLLTDDGVIFISIDENEVRNLMKICEEVFGDDSIDTLIWRKNGKQGNTKKINRFKTTHEYFLAIYKNKQDTLIGKMKLLPNWKNEYPNPDNDPRGNYKAGNISLMEEKSRKGTPNYYSITTPTGVVYTREWFIPKEKYEELDNDKVKTLDGRMVGRIYYPNNGNGVPALKVFKNEEQNYYFDTIIDEMGTFTDAKSEIEQILGNSEVFDTPKPSKILKELIRATTRPYDIVLDFFSGSATTAHAVMQLNAEDGGKRKFIMVQLPEACDEKSEAAKARYKNICEIGKERVRRAGAKIKDEAGLIAQNLDIGFRVLKLDSTNMKDVYYTPEEFLSMAQKQQNLSGFMDNIKEGRTDEDLLFQVMLDLGIPLSAKITQDGDVFYVNVNYLIACFKQVDTAIITELAKKKPFYAVFRDSSFSSDSAMVNLEQVFSTYSPNTIRKVL